MWFVNGGCGLEVGGAVMGGRAGGHVRSKVVNMAVW